MPRVGKDITGEVFGQLTVIRRVGKDSHHVSLWECECSCGNRLTRSYCTLQNIVRRNLRGRCEACKKPQVAWNKGISATSKGRFVMRFRNSRPNTRAKALIDEKSRMRKNDEDAGTIGGSTEAIRRRCDRLASELTRQLDAETLHSPHQEISQRERDLAALFGRQPRPGR